MVCPLDHPRNIIHIRVRNIAHHDPQFAPIINSSPARIESEFGHVQFTINPPGVRTFKHPRGAFIGPIQISFVECFPSFWEVTDRSVARKVTLFLKWKCIIWEGATMVSLLTGVPIVFEQGLARLRPRPSSQYSSVKEDIF